MKIAIVGTGSVGRTLGRGLAAAGHEIVLGTRDPDQTRSRPEWAEENLPVVAYGDLPADAEVVVNATSGAASLTALAAAGEPRLAERVLLDVANPLDFSAGFPPTLLVANTDSLAEQIQRAFPSAWVVKAFNTMTAAVMVNPGAVEAGGHTLFVAGNDEQARQTVVDLARSLGWSDILDLGDLTAARGLEMYLPLWLRLAGALGQPMFNIRVVGRRPVADTQP